MNHDRVYIFDTTLRDGEQSPGASMTGEEKLRIAKALEKLGVDVIEAGFAIASPGDFAAVKAIADSVKDSTVCSLSRAVEADIERAAEALAGANSGRIHTFIATSPIHMQHKLRLAPEQVIEQAVRAVKHARNLCADVEFSCEDAGRSELDFLCRIIEAAIKAGARTINIPDTVGYAIPHQFAETIGQIITRVPNADQAIFSVHCHNDLGLAVANSLAAVAAGARQVECTINGLGERAGNAALEEIVMAIKTRQDVLGVQTNIVTEQILSTSRLVSGITGFPVQPNKAIVGANAFAHESGIHQDGVLKHRETYEIMSAQSVGWHTNRLSLGKLSGRNAFRTRLDELGIQLPGEAELNAAANNGEIDYFSAALSPEIADYYFAKITDADREHERRAEDPAEAGGGDDQAELPVGALEHLLDEDDHQRLLHGGHEGEHGEEAERQAQPAVLQHARQARGQVVPEAAGALADLAPWSDVVICVVSTDSQSRAVVGALLEAGPKPGQVIVVAATNHPGTMIELAEASGARVLLTGIRMPPSYGPGYEEQFCGV